MFCCFSDNVEFVLSKKENGSQYKIIRQTSFQFTFILPVVLSSIDLEVAWSAFCEFAVACVVGYVNVLVVVELSHG